MSAPVRRPRDTRRTVVLLVVLAVVAAGVAWLVVRDDRPEASVGETFPAADPITGTTASYVLLPSGRLDISATGARSDVESDLDVRKKQAPDDGSFVGLQVLPGPGPSITRWSFRGTGSKRPKPTFTLVAGGRRYPVPSYDATGRKLDPDDDEEFGDSSLPLRTYVAIAGHPSSLSLEVGYAGKAQTVDLRTGVRRPGSFAALYANHAFVSSCGPVTFTDRYAADRRAPSCRVELRDVTPYYPGEGWAAAGRTWLVVGVTTVNPVGLTYAARPGRAHYETLGGPDHRYRLDGVTPRRVGRFSNVFGNSAFDVMLFSVPDSGGARTLAVSTTYQGQSRNDETDLGAPRDPRVTASWRVTV